MALHLISHTRIKTNFNAFQKTALLQSPVRRLMTTDDWGGGGAPRRVVKIVLCRNISLRIVLL